MNPKQLKIGITCYPTFGGSGVVATEVGMAMAERGHKVHFICYDVPRRLDRFMQNVYFHEVEVRDNPLFTYPPYSLALASKMVEVVEYEQLDLLHVHYAVPHATSAYLARKILADKSPKIITTLHGTDITLVGNERSYLPITRFSILKSDGVTAPSQFLKHATYDKLNVPTDLPIEIIPNFIDTKRYKPRYESDCPDIRRALPGCTANKRMLVHVSNFRPVKRIGDVVEVFGKIIEQVPCHLVLVGDGPERSKVERIIHENQMSDDVSFLGKQESVVEILQNGCLFLLPSKNESFGLAALEAQGCGLPVIGSNAEGIPEVVVNGETGFLHDVGDVNEMAKSAIQLLTNEKLYEQMSKAARERAVTKFDREVLADQYEQYYLQVLG